MERQREHTAAFTGHRTYSGEATAALHAAIRALYARGYDTFLCGMAAGFDLAAAEAVIARREELPVLRLVAVVPFVGQERRMAAAERARYRAVLACADERVVLAERYDVRCYHRRNDYLVDHASHLIAWCRDAQSGTGYTLRRARAQGIEVVNLAAEACLQSLF